MYVTDLNTVPPGLLWVLTELLLASQTTPSLFLTHRNHPIGFWHPSVVYTSSSVMNLNYLLNLHQLQQQMNKHTITTSIHTINIDNYRLSKINMQYTCFAVKCTSDHRHRHSPIRVSLFDDHWPRKSWPRVIESLLFDDHSMTRLMLTNGSYPKQWPGCCVCWY